MPVMSPTYSLSNIITPAGVQETSCARPLTSRPALVGVSASTSLAGSSMSSTALSRTCLGSGIWTNIPCTDLIVIERATRARTSASLGIGRQAVVKGF